MEKIIDFNELKANKNGDLTPRAVVNSVAEFIGNNPGDVEMIAIVVRMSDGRINTAYSTAKHLELMGLYETGKLLVYDDM